MEDLRTGPPVVTFSGQGPRSRNDYVEEAVAAGWIVWGKPVEGLDVMVIGEDHSARKVDWCKRRGVPVISYEQWQTTIATGEI